jgi:hypothetical protein
MVATDRSPVGHNAARGYTVPRQAESPGHAGERGTQLCGANRVQSDVKRELSQR